MSRLGASAFSVGDRVVVGPTGQIGTVEYIEPRYPISGQIHLHIRISECPWKLVQPEISLHQFGPEEE